VPAVARRPRTDLRRLPAGRRRLFGAGPEPVRPARQRRHLGRARRHPASQAVLAAAVAARIRPLPGHGRAPRRDARGPRRASARRKQLVAEDKEVDNDTAKKAEVWEVLDRSGALPAVGRLLDWTAWSVDKLYVQHLREDVRRAMKDKHADSDAALEKIFADLADLAAPRTLGRPVPRLQVHG